MASSAANSDGLSPSFHELPAAKWNLCPPVAVAMAAAALAVVESGNGPPSAVVMKPVLLALSLRIQYGSAWLQPSMVLAPHAEEEEYDQASGRLPPDAGL